MYIVLRTWFDLPCPSLPQQSSQNFCIFRVAKITSPPFGAPISWRPGAHIPCPLLAATVRVNAFYVYSFYFEFSSTLRIFQRPFFCQLLTEFVSEKMRYLVQCPLIKYTAKYLLTWNSLTHYQWIMYRLSLTVSLYGINTSLRLSTEVDIWGGGAGNVLSTVAFAADFYHILHQIFRTKQTQRQKYSAAIELMG